MLSSSLHAAELLSVRHSSTSDSVRIVLEFDGPVQYSSLNDKNSTVIDLPGATAKYETVSSKVYDGMLQDFSIKKSDDGLNVYFSTNYPVEVKVFSLDNPFRIVADLPRAEKTTASSEETCTVAPEENEVLPSSDSWFSKAQKVADGLSFLDIDLDTGDNAISAYALLVDRNKLDVVPQITVPYIKGGEGSSFFGSLLGFFGLGKSNERPAHYSKHTVSSFVKMSGALAGVNGSYFFSNGTPVGALIVKGQVVSSPLLNRTALILYKDGRSAIDALKMEGYLYMKNGETLGFSGVNQPLKNDEIIVYTPDYQFTDPSSASVNVIVENSAVTDIKYGETGVPKNGFVISGMGGAGDTLRERFRKGDPVRWFFMASPPLDDIEDVIAAGPRLVYEGKPCVTSVEEKFKNDIAKGRAARTAVGITGDGRLIFLVVEKNGKSRGATLQELSKLMIKLGADDAMNLDGGGSSAMVVTGSVINNGGKRPVSNAIVIKRK